jgi:sensor histidine kinase YesM
LDELHVQEVPLRREIEFLEHYVSIQQRRFGERLQFDLQIDPRGAPLRSSNSRPAADG